MTKFVATFSGRKLRCGRWRFVRPRTAGQLSAWKDWKVGRRVALLLCCLCLKTPSVVVGQEVSQMPAAQSPSDLFLTWESDRIWLPPAQLDSPHAGLQWVEGDQATDVEALVTGNPLSHQGNWLRAKQHWLPIESLSDNYGLDPASIDAYDDIVGVEVIDSSGGSQRISMRIGGRAQVRHTYFQDESVFSNPSSNQFEISRARLGFRGYVLEDYLRYNLGLDMSPGNARLVNAFAEVNLQDALGLGFGTSTRLRYGFWRTNFGRQAAESSQRMQFVDRSLASAVFNLGTNTGLSLIGGFTAGYRPVRYELNLSNGFGTFALTSRESLDAHPAVALRVTQELFGDYQSGESDHDLSPFAAVRSGFSLGYTRRTRRGPEGSTAEFDNGPAFLLVADPVAGEAVFAMDQLRGIEQAYDLWLAGVELDCKHAGWSLHTEYLFRWIDNVQFNSDHDFRDYTHGFYVQGGYFLTEKVEVVARQSTIYARGEGRGSPTGANYRTTSNATGVGVNFYFRRDFSKLQVDVFHYDGAPIRASALNLNAGDQGTMVRAQYQIAF